MKISPMQHGAALLPSTGPARFAAAPTSTFFRGTGVPAAAAAAARARAADLPAVLPPARGAPV